MSDNDRALDIEIAQLLGWRWEGDEGGVHYLRRPNVPGYLAMRAGDDLYPTSDLLPYSTDHTAVRLVEDEIERRGLVGPYVKALYAIVGKQGSWSLIRATPEQRCAAALRAVGGRG